MMSKKSKSGSAPQEGGYSIAIVVIMLAVLALVAAGTLRSALTELRINKMSELYTEAINIAEIGVDYGYATAIQDTVNSVGIYDVDSDYFNTTDTPSSLTTHIAGVDIQTVEIRGSDVRNQVRKKIARDNPSDTYKKFLGKFVYEAELDLYCKATASEPSLSRDSTAYVKKTVKIIEAPLFSHALFYNDELQMHRNFSIAGDVHTNGNLLINTHDGDDTMEFFGTLTAAGNYYRGTTVDSSGSGRDPFGNSYTLASGLLDFSQVTLGVKGRAEIQGIELEPGFDSRTSEWLTDDGETFGGNFIDKTLGATTMSPIGSEYSSRDLAGNTANEYNNGGYSLIEPLLPTGHVSRKSSSARANKLAYQADLVLRVEYNQSAVDDYDTTMADIATWPTNWSSQRTAIANARIAAAEALASEQYVMRAYSYSSNAIDGDPVYVPVSLPNKMVGSAVEVLTGTTPTGYEITSTNNAAYIEPYSAATNVESGLMDTRTGRPMDLFSLDVSQLKRAIETSNASLGTSADDLSIKQFRDDLGIETGNTWDGIVYVELPTSLTASSTANTTGGIESYAFEYASAATKNPEELSTVTGTPDRTDDIVPIAPEFRTQDNTDNGMGIQIINAHSLPQVGSSPGFTIASNGSIYTVGHFNADGNLSTGTNIGSGDNTLATADTSVDEIPAAIFGDSVTMLSETWPEYRHKSNQGSEDDAYGRKPDGPLEISAGVVSGDYPVFEFFVRSLEAWQHLVEGSYPNPIVVKGSLVSLYDSEIPLIKNAFGRDVADPIDLYWNAFAAYAFTTVRYHEFFSTGRFPPGTPNARSFDIGNFQVLYPADTDNRTELVAAGYTLP